MARFAKGSRALAISDRSGAAFPYREMVKEWNGAFVHNSEFEPKQPQLEPHPVGADPQGLMNADQQELSFQYKIFYPTILLQLQPLTLVLVFLILLIKLMKAQLL